MRIVLDTNVVVSALRNDDGNPALVVELVLTGAITFVYSAAILAEYREVLARPRLQLDPPSRTTSAMNLLPSGKRSTPRTSTTVPSPS